ARSENPTALEVSSRNHSPGSCRELPSQACCGYKKDINKSTKKAAQPRMVKQLFYIIHSTINEAKTYTKTALKIISIVLIDPSFKPLSKAREVPIAWDAEPNPTPSPTGPSM